jgi:hypothetical protein
MKTERWRFLPAAKDVHFDIDRYINRFVFSSQVHKFPKPIARFLGYRKQPQYPVGNILLGLWALLGAFVGLVLVGAAFRYSDLKHYHTPVLFASLVCYTNVVIEFVRLTSNRAPRRSLTTMPFSHPLRSLVHRSSAKASLPLLASALPNRLS